MLRWVGLAAIVLVGLLYVHPLRSYLQAKHDLARRTADVQALKAEKRDLQHRLAESSTGQALTEQARRLGLVRPGEKLYIVKGISAWVHEQDYDRPRWKMTARSLSASSAGPRARSAG